MQKTESLDRGAVHISTLQQGQSTRVVYMNQGVICEQSTPDEVFGHPKKQETKDFLARFLNA